MNLGNLEHGFMMISVGIPCTFDLKGMRMMMFQPFGLDFEASDFRVCDMHCLAYGSRKEC